MTIFDGITRPALRFFGEGDGLEETFTGEKVIEWYLMRGRTKRFEPLQPSVLRVAFDNRDGAFDVLTGGTRVAWDTSLVCPDTTVIPIHGALLHSVHQYRGLTPSTVVEALDVLSFMQRQQLTPAYLNANGAEGPGVRALRILTDYGWTGFATLEDSGYPCLVDMLSSFGNINAMDALQQCAACTGGNYYVRRDRSIQLSDPLERLTRSTVLAFSDAGGADTVPYLSAVMTPASEQIVNTVTVYRPSRGTGAGQATKATYLDSSRSIRWDAPMALDYQAQALAAYLARIDATPSETVSEIEFAGVDFLRNASTLTYNTLAALEIGDKITVTRSGVTYSCTVEGIKHTGTTREWKITLYLSPWNDYSANIAYGIDVDPGVGTYIYATPGDWTLTSAVDTVRAATSLDIKWRDFSDRGSATGTLELFANAKQEIVYDSNSTGAYQFNCKGGSATSMPSTIDVGQCVEFDVLIKCNSSAHYANSVVLVDGISTHVTTIWLGGAPTSGNSGGWDRYKLKVYMVNAEGTYRVVAERKSSA